MLAASKLNLKVVLVPEARVLHQLDVVESYVRSPCFASVLSAQKVSRQIDPHTPHVYSNYELGGNHNAHNFYSYR